MDNGVLYIAIGAAVAGLIQGLSGFAFGLVAMTFWSWFVEPQLAGPMVVFGSIIGQLLSFKTIHRGLRRELITPLITGGILGVPVGIYLLHFFNPNYFKLCIGIILIIFCSIMLFSKKIPQVGDVPKWVENIIGFMSGILGGIAGLTGPVITLWCTARTWSADTQRAVFQTFNLTMHCVTLAGYLASGLIDLRALRMFAVIAPAMLVPAIIGNLLYPRLDQKIFRRFILGLLIASGIAIIFSASAAHSLGHSTN